MRILIVHNTYQQAGGEDVVVRAETAMLQSGGHEVVVRTVSNHDIGSLREKATAALSIDYNRSRHAWMTEQLRDVRPDIVHIHNFFPLLTYAVHAATKQHGLPVVQTLHNFRLLCAAATFERRGEICEKCLGGERYHALIHRCYRCSLIGTAAVVRMQRRAHARQGIISNTDRFIALTEFARGKFIQGGFPGDRLVVKPNFIRVDSPEHIVGGGRTGALFVGRLVEEKGVRCLLKAWRNLADIPLTIIGDGPLRAELEAVAPANVQFTGFLPSDQVYNAMKKAGVLVMPSTWYEGFPVTLVEAMGNGLPVIASKIGSLAEIVVHGKCGLHFTPNDASDLVKTVQAFFSASIEMQTAMGDAAKMETATTYSEKANLRQLVRIYESAAGIQPGRAIHQF